MTQAAFYIDGPDNEDWPKRTDDTLAALFADASRSATHAEHAHPMHPIQAAVPGMRSQRTAVRRLTRLRGSTGTRLRAAGEQAYSAALRQAGVRVNSRARSRLSKGRQAQVAAAVDARQPLAGWLGAVGITELELLRGSFDAFADQARAELERYWSRVDQALERAGYDPSRLDSRHIGDAVEYLVAGWYAVARRRLLLGDEALLAALPHRGFDRQDTPGSDPLVGIGARLTRSALRINEGAATFTAAAGPDDLPAVIDTGLPPLEVQYAFDVGLVSSATLPPIPPSVQAAVNEVWKDIAAGEEATARGEKWRWQHGFYGEPTQVFEKHDDLDGLLTNDDADERLLNDDAWPETDFFYPGDHDGCTCEWVLDV